MTPIDPSAKTAGEKHRGYLLARRHEGTKTQQKQQFI
jgi:hypothetical protein